MTAPTPPPADGQYVIKLATILQANGKARSWSHALELARQLAAPPTTKPR